MKDPLPKALLVEPNRVLARQYAVALGLAQFDVQWASDGQMGVYLADKATPDIVISELLLAGHSGIEFLYEFRTYVEWGRIPAVILTGVPPREMAGTSGSLARLGVTHVLYKPYTTLEHLRTVARRAFADSTPAPSVAQAV